MPLYRVTLPDGTQYKVEAPEGTSNQALRFAAERFAREEELGAAQSRLSALRSAPPPAAPPPETSFFGNVKEALKGVIPGAAGLLETAGAGASSVLPEEQEQAVRQGLKSFREGVSQFPLFEVSPGYEESVGRKFGQALGSTLPFFATAPYGAVGRGIGTLLGVSAGAGEARMGAEAKGATEGERAAATALGAPTGLLDMLAPGMGAGIKNIVVRAFARGGIEGATEAAQKVAQNLIAKGVYDPTQEILAGSGEEGAYGAGVGALASLIIDSTIGRRARMGATPAAPAAAPTTPTAPAPEAPGTVPPSMFTPQGELFARDLSLAQRQRAAAAQARPEFELTPPEAPTPDTQLQLPFGEPVAAPTAVPGQRDMIAESETQQAQELVDQDEMRQIEQMLFDQARQEEAARAEQERLKFESDLAETDARRMAAEQQRTEDHRLEILRTIIAEPSVKNIQATFGDALKIAGYTDTNFTPRERQMIGNANAVRVAEPAQPPAPEVIPAAPAQLGAMEAAIPERREVREPQQLGIPGIGKREAPVAEAPAAPEAQFTSVLTPEVLDRTGLPKQSGFYKQLVNKDMSDPAQQSQVRDVLVRVRTNPTLSPATKAGIERVAMQAFGALAKQTEMFGPRGGVIAPAGGARSEGVRTQPAGTGAGVSPVTAPQPVGRGQAPVAAPAAPVPAAPRPAGLGVRGEPAGRTDAGKRVVPAPVTPQKQLRDRLDKIADRYEELGNSQKAREVYRLIEAGTATPEQVAEMEKQQAKTKISPKRQATNDFADVLETTGGFKGAPYPGAKKDEAGRWLSKDGQFTIIPVGGYGWQVVDLPTAKFVEEYGFGDSHPNLQAIKAFTLAREGKDPATVRKEAVKAFDQDYDSEVGAHIDQMIAAAKEQFNKAVAPAPAPAPAKPKGKKKLPAAATLRKMLEKGSVERMQIREARAGYLNVAGGNADKALDYLAHDMAYAMYPEKNVAIEVNKITLDLASDKIPDPKFSKRDEVYAPGTGGKFAKRYFDSLSLQEYKQLAAKLRDIFQGYAAQEMAVNDLNAAQRRAREDTSDKDAATRYGLDLEAPILGMKMHPAMQERLAAGDLVGALRVMSGLSDGRISVMAERVAANMGDTKVVLSDDVKNEAGKPVAGRYDPATDTIYMNTSMGMSGHTLLHEAVHAVTSHILANPNHPITKQLTALYENAKPYLDTAYGAKSLDEFVAEAFSNPRFQEQLSGIPAQGDTTVFQRFVRAVQNFVRRLLGMDAKPVESTMDATDRLVMEIMSPAPQYRGAGSLYAASATGNPRDPLDIFSKTAMSVPTLNQERIYKFREFFTGTAPDKVKEGIRAALPLNALVDVAKNRIPMAERIGELVDERAGSENKRNQMIEPVIKRVSEWAAANGTKIDALNKVIYGSTLFQVDPNKPRADYEKKVDDSGNKLVDVWDRMQPMWQSLGEDGRGVYRQMRDTYAALHKDIERVLFNRIDDALKDDPTAAKKTKDEIYKRLFASGKIEPYFPLTRTGKYWLSYNADGEFYVEAYETAAMRDDAIKELKTAAGVDEKSIQKFANISQINYRNVPSTSFVNNILQTLEATKKGASPESKARIDETISGVMNLFLNTLPETSFAQSFRRRKGTLGFNQDAVGALRSKTYNMSRQLANIEYGAKLESVRAAMQEHVKAQGSQEVDAAYMEEFNKRIDFAISPNVPAWSKVATSVGFAYTLGFNVSSAIVNLAQIPIVVMPYLGGRYGYGATTAAIGRATRAFMGSGLEREAQMLVPVKDDKGNEVEKSLTVRAAPSIDNYDFNDPKNKDIKHLETLVRIAGSRGQLNRSLSYDVLEVDERESVTAKINKYSGFVFHHGERMNRQVALVTAYELELDRLNKSGAKLDDGRLANTLSDAQKEEYAANQAIYLAELTNGGTAAAAAPRIAQNGIGRVIFMYKRYGVSMYYMLFKTARDAMKNEDPEVRKAAMKQIAGIYASSALMAGVKGVPLFGIAAMIYNLFTDDDEDDFDTAARKAMPEWAFSGLANALTGVDVASRIGLSDLLFRDGIVKDQPNPLFSLVETMGGPVFGITSRVIRGVQLINEGNVERGIEQVLPSAIAAPLKAVRFGTEGALTLRGDPITNEFGVGQVVAQAFGFTPADYTRQLEINAAGKKIDRAANEERTKLLRNYYVALRTGDQSGAQKVAEKMQDFNKRHPTAAITGETVKNSLAQHMKTSQEMVGGVLYSKRLRPEIMRSLQEFEGDADSDEE